ncbi:MAG: Bacterial membrane flanked domain protein [Lentisphaerae bacterium ADurb.Bin242]|nr:MAG: Bacterial membrane flanked domain protein [Lentisphaerae bacterium ADurb.Bin242]
MSNQVNEKILYRIKGNRFLFIVRNVWNTIGFAVGIILSVGLGSLMASGISGMIWNDGKMNMCVIYLGMTLTPLIIAIRFLHIILLRKNQFYIISTSGVTSEGGVLNRFSQTLRLNEVRSVSYTQTLIQQILGCGNIVISSSATYRAGLVLSDVDHVKEIYAAIEHNR